LLRAGPRPLPDWAADGPEDLAGEGAGP
jgi:hypothetical protein